MATRPDAQSGAGHSTQILTKRDGDAAGCWLLLLNSSNSPNHLGNICELQPHGSTNASSFSNPCSTPFYLARSIQTCSTYGGVDLLASKLPPFLVLSLSSDQPKWLEQIFCKESTPFDVPAPPLAHPCQEKVMSITPLYRVTWQDIHFAIMRPST
jgi:hypothetical protein